MGEIVGAGFLSHAPTIMLPKEIRFELNEGKEISLRPGLERLRAEVLDLLAPDAIIVFDTHWFTTVEFIVTGHARREGRYTSEELPRGMSQVPFDLRGDPELATSIAEQVVAAGVRCIANDDAYLPINYPTINLAHFLNRGEAWLSMSICQTAEDDDFLTAGRALGDAVAQSNARTVLLASGGMSHRFWPLKELEKHEASDPSHIITPEARAADTTDAKIGADEIQLLAELRQLRAERIAQIKAQIEAGTYESDELLDAALGRMLNIIETEQPGS